MSITGTQLMNQIIDYGLLRGWRIHHDRPAMTFKGYRTAVQGHKGFPDILLVKPPRILVIECKSTSEKVSPEQYDWISDFKDCGITTMIARPCDWDNIQKELER
jgi:hypothetical protein